MEKTHAKKSKIACCGIVWGCGGRDAAERDFEARVFARHWNKWGGLFDHLFALRDGIDPSDQCALDAIRGRGRGGSPGHGLN